MKYQYIHKNCIDSLLASLLVYVKISQGHLYFWKVLSGTSGKYAANMEIDWFIDLVVRLVLIKLTGKLSRGIKQCHLCPFPKRQNHFPWLFAVHHLQVSRSQWVSLHHPLLSTLVCLAACCLTSSDDSRWSDCGGSPAKACLMCTEATWKQGMIPMIWKWPFLPGSFGCSVHGVEFRILTAARIAHSKQERRLRPHQGLPW